MNSKQCCAKTAKGQQCKKKTLHGKYCSVHKNLDPGDVEESFSKKDKDPKKDKLPKENQNFKIKCRGITKKRTACSKDATKGSLYCNLHSIESDIKNAAEKEPPKEKILCSAITKTGHPCPKACYKDTIYCYFHRFYEKNKQKEDETKKQREENEKKQKEWWDQYNKNYNQYQNYYPPPPQPQVFPQYQVVKHFTDDRLNKKFSIMTLDIQNKILEAIKKLDLDIKNIQLDILHRTYRKHAREHHPDKGGDPEQFKVILNHKDILETFLESLS